jgi:hypothetical protein
MDGLAAKIAAEGGTIMGQDDFVLSKMKKSKRQGDGDDDGKGNANEKTDGKKKEETKKAEEEKIEYDKDGRPIIKFRKVDAVSNPNKKNVKKLEGGKEKKPGVKNQTLLSFGDDEGEQ